MSFRLGFLPCAAAWAALVLGCGARSGPFLGDEGRGPSGAAYQPPGPDEPEPEPEPDPCDVDGDGHRRFDCGGDDCDDADPARHPGAADVNAGIGRWVNERVSGGDGGETRPRAAIHVDARGVVRLAHSVAGLWYAERGARSWQSQKLAPQAARAPAMAVSGSAVAVAFVAEETGLWLATDATGSWVTANVDPDAHGAVSVALTEGGAAHVGYVAGKTLRHASNEAGGFAIDQLATDVERTDLHGASATVGADGHPSIAYVAERGLVVVRRSDDGFAETVVHPGNAASPSLVQAGDSLHLGYCACSVPGGGIRYARWESGWSIAEVTKDTFLGVALALGPDGRPGLALAGLDRFLATQTGDGWALEELPLGPNAWGHGIALAIDGGGAAHVAYSGFTFGEGSFVSYATNRVIEPDGIDQNCDGVDGVDADGDGHAADTTGGDDCDDYVPGLGCRD